MVVCDPTVSELGSTKVRSNLQTMPLNTAEYNLFVKDTSILSFQQLLMSQTFGYIIDSVITILPLLAMRNTIPSFNYGVKMSKIKANFFHLFLLCLPSALKC